MNRTAVPAISVVDQIHLPQVDSVKLANGIPAYLINAGEQDVVKIEWLFKAGKWYEEKNLVADITNRMLREGTLTKPAKEVADTFEYYGANFNCAAGFETAGITLYCLTKQVEHILPLVFEILSEPAFPEHELATILHNRKEQHKVNLEKNEFLANRHFAHALWGKTHPYGRVTEFEDFDRMDVSDLRTFFTTHYSPNNCTLLISGKFDDSLLKTINTFFGDKAWQGAYAPADIKHGYHSSELYTQHFSKQNSVQASILVGNVSITKSHPDFSKLSILNTLFGGYFGSRLMTNIREDKGYTYGIYSSFNAYPHEGFLEIGAEVGSEVREQTLSEIEHEIKTLRNEPISEEELQTVKNYMSGSLLRKIDGPLKFSETFKSLLIYNQDLQSLHTLLETIHTVTSAELQALAVQYLDFDRMYRVSVG